ncbi:MAG TPA: ATP-binding protein [Solirubrobacteraceae bacterium]|nr:ATP-binding protein [Solirubrobacteraceae bacterium]
MSAARNERRPPSPPRSFRIQGGAGAPGRARDHLLEYLDPAGTSTRASDALLIVSELVTNSVVHADVDAGQALSLELATRDHQLRIAVSDTGSGLQPRLLPAHPERAGSVGLRMVDQLSVSWGVERDLAGLTRVWCELPLDEALTHVSDGVRM